jgi:hypothetical protein
VVPRRVSHVSHVRPGGVHGAIPVLARRGCCA